MAKTTKKATKKTVKKTTAKKETKKVSEKNGAVKKTGLMEGSTRLRLFKALAKFKNGLSAKQIKEKTGMLPVSGHLARILEQEYDSGRIKVEQHDIGGRDTFVYLITAKGLKHYKAGSIDKNKTAGKSIGKKWHPNRVKAEKAKA